MTDFVTSCVSYQEKESSRHRRAASWRQLIRKYGIVDCVAVCMQGISFVAERLVESARTGDRAAWRELKNLRVFMRKKKQVKLVAKKLVMDVSWNALLVGSGFSRHHVRQ